MASPVTTNRKKPPLNYDLEAALKVLRTPVPPEEQARRSPEQIRKAKDILEKIRSQRVPDHGPTDGSENLDFYIYGQTDQSR